MKKATFILCMLVSSATFSQTVASFDTIKAPALQAPTIIGSSFLGGNIVMKPNSLATYGSSFYERGRVDIAGNLTIGYGLLQNPTMYFGAGNPGFVRWVGDHNVMSLKLMDSGEMYGTLKVGTIKATGYDFSDFPTYQNNAAARSAGLEKGRGYFTPSGTLKRVI